MLAEEIGREISRPARRVWKKSARRVSPRKCGIDSTHEGARRIEYIARS
jgi:hypothetical protein